MGAWGVAIFSDDTASDIKGDWQDGLREGKQPETLTQDLIRSYDKTINDPDESKTFWLALAAAQHETGHLEASVRDKALVIIKSGGDVERWAEEDPSLAKQRKTVLEKLAAKLEGPQSKPKKLRPLQPKGVNFDIGDVVQLCNRKNGATAIVVVVAGIDGWPRGTIDPVVEMLLWEKPTLPTSNEILKLPTLLSEGAFGKARPHMYSLGTHTKKQAFSDELGVIIAKGVMRRPSGDFKSNDVQASYTTWPALTRFIGHEGIAKDIALTKQHTQKSGWRRLFK